jgi:hypothetical protein
MQEIYRAMKEKKQQQQQQQPHKTTDQLSDEDYKVAPTSADKEEIFPQVNQKEKIN